MEENLLRQFDELIEKKSYSNRSEAVRDLVRNALVSESIQKIKGNIFGVLVFIYDHHKRELEKELTNIQHNHYHNIIATTHVHIDHDNCLEVILLKGISSKVKTISEKIISLKGVKHGKLTLTTTIKK